MTKEIVIAAYDRNLAWTNELNESIIQTRYRKGDIRSDENEIILENKGGCVHTFFNHLYTKYYTLSDYTFFVQDYPFDHWGNLIEVINKDMNKLDDYVTLKIGGYYGFHNNTLGTAWYMPPTHQFDAGRALVCQSNGAPQDNNPNIDVNRVWDILFDEVKPPVYEFIPGGHFAITKEHVQLRTRYFYKQVVDLLEHDVNMPWMIERLECYIFNPKFKTFL